MLYEYEGGFFGFNLGIETYELFRPENEAAPGIDIYMKRFSRDVIIAVEESVKRSLKNVQRQYRAK
jgi:hypothetical protein